MISRYKPLLNQFFNLYQDESPAQQDWDVKMKDEILKTIVEQ